MGSDQKWEAIAPALPAVSPLNPERDEYWSRFDDSVNAVSFGFVATAILISMFLVMAIFERFLRPRSPAAIGRPPSDLEAQMMLDGKPRYPSPKGGKAKRKRGKRFRQALMFYWSEVLIHLFFKQIYNSVLFSTVAVQCSSH
ncbi:uncharacterized protein LOC111811824 isoform X2 [Cucurbita pepo subsp. pepo]|uniref:uncharacterized protein LOC111811824 isoform X2 n=1 Tax=Cucurbita pepo subsp. pepo TaxID=3664 RepID=UPI000C9D8774|nr:uncharacterized protein LOC111811824 isoform X2 [Cucurbita pepo subsp. pepo]